MRQLPACRTILAGVLLVALAGCSKHSSQTSPSPTSPSGPPPTFTVTPFVTAAEVHFEGGYSADHNGIDIGANVSGASFRAVCDGVFRKPKFQNDKTGRWQVNATIEHASGYSAVYTFEPFGNVNDSAPANAQWSNLVADGKTVRTGEILGTLYCAAAGCHVHFGVIPWQDPMPLFTGTALDQMRAFVGS